MIVAFSIAMPIFALAQTTTSISDATNPNMERYCDPAQNADVMAKVQEYQNTLDKLNGQKDANSPGQRNELINKIVAAGRQLKCIYRTKAN
jgi:hypothetical protein